MNYLLAVDVQKEFAKGMAGKAAYNRMLNYIKKAQLTYDAVYAAIYQNTGNKNMIRLVHWDEMHQVDSLEFRPDEFWTHGGYSILKYPWFTQNDMVTVIGFDTDACVLSTCFDLFNNDINFRVIADGCFSSGGKAMHRCGLEIMDRQFKNAVDYTTKL